MKNIKYALTALLLFVALPAISQTNFEQVAASVKVAAATNVNQVMIDILSGVKDAGKEIYGASKEALHTSLNFVSEQAPEVITQFLSWRFFLAFGKALLWSVGVGTIFFFAYKFRKYQDKASDRRDYRGDPSERELTVACKWICVCVAVILFILGVGSNGLEMVKIKVAPKVYLIEYVVDTVKGGK